MDINVRNELIDGKPNPYWEGKMGGRDKEYIKGYDNCVEQQVEGFFENIRDYEEAFKEADIDVNDLDIVAIVADDFSDDEVKALDPKTRLFGVLHDCLLDYIEKNRTDIIAGMVETNGRG
jgi:hypothetical protein